jgi:hypothetical protein
MDCEDDWVDVTGDTRCGATADLQHEPIEVIVHE